MSTMHGYYNHPQVQAELFDSYEAARSGSTPLGSFGGLGSAEDDVKRILSLIPGASGYYNSLVALIQEKAKEGALQAVPEIKAQVESTVKPFVIAAMLLGFAGFAIGVSTYMMNRRG